MNMLTFAYNNRVCMLLQGKELQTKMSHSNQEVRQ